MRALRTAAKANVWADNECIKASVQSESDVSVITGRITAGAQDVLDEAKDVAEEHSGILMAAGGVAFLWIFRRPLFGRSETKGEEISEPNQREIAECNEMHTAQRAAERSGDHHDCQKENLLDQR